MILKTGLISRVAFELFEIPIYWYAILIVSSMIVGLIWCKYYNGRFGVKFDEILDLAIFVIPISIICARIYYILFNLDFYVRNLNEIIRINNGGMAIYGGIIGGFLTIYVYCKIKKRKILNITDYIVPVLALAQSIGRWGNYINVEAYGYETESLIKMEVIENGLVKYVHPTFLYESFCTFVIFIILSILSKNRKFEGQITYTYIILYSFIRFFIEGVRIDSLMWGNFRVSQILSLILFMIFGFILIYNKNKHKQMSKMVEKGR